ncbi:hypothetical protein BP5796_03608 [Coleophoma crateriformis]|uniref:Zn(2)-C6 fungal-type domain-containing protein n=1 Tax=Coleophoma crateriformis TaxID=565419 RepID=A0A3D8SP04_9HELO|nr:hypothetical protein BP5796_03608 [Coleophoma crateriformis]
MEVVLPYNPHQSALPGSLQLKGESLLMARNNPPPPSSTLLSRSQAVSSPPRPGQLSSQITRKSCPKCRNGSRRPDDSPGECKACAHLNAQQAHHRRLTYSPGSMARAALFSNGSVVLRNDQERKLVGTASEILHTIICPVADKSCRDFAVVISISIREPWIRDAMMAFALSVKATHSEDCGDRALRSYQLALAGLRENFLSSNDTSKTPMLIVAANFLGLLETLCSSDPRRPMVHFMATAQLIHHFNSNSSWKQDAKFRGLYRIMVECTVYNIAVLSIFYDDLEGFARKICWDSLKSSCPQYSSIEGSLRSTTPRGTTAFLGGRLDFYCAMFDIIRFARQDMSESERKYQVSAFSERLDEIEDAVTAYYGIDILPIAGEIFCRTYKLQFLALRIILAKAEDHTRCSASPVIADLFNQALVLLMLGNLEGNVYPVICWPITILSFAVECDVTFELLKERAVVFKKGFHKGHGDRMMRAINAVGEYRKNGHGYCERRFGRECSRHHDGLEFLVHPQGCLVAERGWGRDSNSPTPE